MAQYGIDVEYMQLDAYQQECLTMALAPIWAKERKGIANFLEKGLMHPLICSQTSTNMVSRISYLK